jgi:hypothetical protein
MDNVTQNWGPTLLYLPENTIFLPSNESLRRFCVKHYVLIFAWSNIFFNGRFVNDLNFELWRYDIRCQEIYNSEFHENYVFNFICGIIFMPRRRYYYVLNEIYKHHHICNRLDSNWVNSWDNQDHIPFLHTLRNMTTLKSQPRDYSVSTHGKTNLKEGNYIHLGPNRENLKKNS